MRRSMLEPNVRDYQGAKNVINTAIGQTLAAAAASEFWWLNNGVTILATKCSVVGNTVVIEKPEVVNGLQTSYEIFEFFKAHPDKTDTRNVLVRVIVPPDEQVRSKIIRATNSQTAINEVQLRATDPIHFDIEEKFRLYGLFYERRKGEYRELKKPVDQIISIQLLARAVIALLLQQPNNAYATPGRVLKSDYEQVFDENHSRDMFVACMTLHRQVDKYLSGRDDLKSVRSIIKYYVSMTVACMLLKKADAPTDKELASLLPAATKTIDGMILEECTDIVFAAYQKHGGTETAAKGPEMRATILKELKADLAPKGGLV
ncbi:AIPR family protein [Bradyrhizobium sp. AUGA SZCCT0160]|uniref:AIPR family protein n=1 Tax=Bradyrhizobium sp. AUGA SZCCT0160 TaxID=2807662 RepID=UPI001BAC47C0|nr:AIPR family protein [Bradyrhizobium sp. AUGA SZCCT0160]MBR1194089.1 AIPR family protein [Bradyrhizobium sp. AUGA SZCCT0160]